MTTITKLKENEVFVFGANADGFHGAGAAGDAFGVIGNWYENGDFLRSKKELVRKQNRISYDETKLIGKWAILGQVGLMVGKEGKSYGIVTTQKPGIQGYVNLNYLKEEITKLFYVANAHPNYNFICTNFGLKRPKGLSWFDATEIHALWQEVGPAPTNIKPPTYF
jgi:hypothetical protein